MPPKIKSSKLLKNIYQKATSLIDEQPVVKDIVKGNNPDYTQVHETSIKGKLPDVILNDPYFKPITPFSRQGPYGEEIVYGTRKATPQQIASGEDIKYRLINLGYDIDIPIPIEYKGNYIIEKPSTFIDMQAQKPMDIIDIPQLTKPIIGYRSWGADDTSAFILHPRTYTDQPQDVQIHESLMHGTDPLIVALDKQHIKDPITNEYDQITSRVPRQPVLSPDKWYELRATLGEIRNEWYEFLGRKQGKDFQKEAKITPEMREAFYQAVDGWDREDWDVMLNSRGYGQSYYKVLDLDQRRKKAQGKKATGNFPLNWMKLLLKYYPAIGIGTSTIYNLEPDNYVEERKYKNGGQIYKKNLNKFTASKKRF